MITVLSGGTGTPKLLQGLKEVIDPKEITIVVNTLENEYFSGVYVSADIDTVLYTMADMINEEFYIESQIFINMIMQIGRVIGYGLLFIIGLSNNIIYFKTLLLITTLIIPLYSYYMYQLHYK